MNTGDRPPIRVLVADDEPDVLDAYRTVLGVRRSAGSAAITDLKARLFGTAETTPPSADDPVFDVVFTPGAEAAVQAVRESIEQYSWPGNIRELVNLLTRAVVLARGGIFAPELLAQCLKRPVTGRRMPLQ